MASINLIRYALQILLSYFLFSTNYNNGVEGARRLISKEEDIEFEKQVKLLNKPAVKTIQTKFGDIYDCIDFYKQPAFDHPLLKNHTFHPQMRPSSLPQLMSDEELFKFSSKEFDIEFKGVERCPSGTVPIRRVTKDDLIREKLHAERYGSNFSVLTIENPGTHYAMVQTTFDPNKKYNGGSTVIGVYNPSVVGGSQYSSGRIKIQNGLESIQAGWTVNPTLYGDNRTRLYIYLNGGQLRCFDTRCPGFVIVDTSIVLGDVLDVSQIGGVTSLITFSIFRDAPVGNWWFGSADGSIKVGFWPQKLFSSLADLATSVEWGGEVFSPPDVPSPPMGSGGSLRRGYTKVDAFCSNMKSINEAREIMDAMNTQVYRDINLYDAVDGGNVGGDWKHLMYFGGPGGATGK